MVGTAGVTLESTAAGDGSRTVKSAERTLRILELLAEAGRGSMTLASIAKELQLPKSSLHALLRTMEVRGWVDTDPAGRRYSLALRALMVGTAYVDIDLDVAAAQPALDWLSEQTGETVHLGRLDGADIVYLAKRESTHPLRLFSAVGRRLPAHATALGKVLLSSMPWEEVEQRLPAQLASLTSTTITDHVQLREELADIARLGYAWDDQENTDGIRCVAAVVARPQGRRDAISVSVPMVRLDPRRSDEFREAVQKAARMASEARG